MDGETKHKRLRERSIRDLATLRKYKENFLVHELQLCVASFIRKKNLLFRSFPSILSAY
jgi:hypothetical protein